MNLPKKVYVDHFLKSAENIRQYCLFISIHVYMNTFHFCQNSYLLTIFKNQAPFRKQVKCQLLSYKLANQQCHKKNILDGFKSK